jgi:hypothetical protein
MRHLGITVIFILAATVNASAQHPAHPDVVAQVKAQLQAQGVDLSGPCGAWQITKGVAWALQAEGVGLLSKPSGNNCDGYSVDYVTYQDGSGVDILGDAGTTNAPGWDVNEPPGALLGRWRAPIAPGGTPPPPVVVVPPAPPGYDLDAIQRQMRIENQLLIAQVKLDALKEQIRAHDEEPMFVTKLFGNRYVQILLATLGTYVTTRQMTDNE